MVFDEIKKNFGFGCMRLPMDGDKVDYDEFNRMIDYFIESGFNYFDTAHGYIDGKSETAIRDCLAARYKREEYILADKLSAWMFKEEKDILPLFEKQLALCGVEYFDFYLFHCLNRTIYPKLKKCNAFEIIKDLKKQGKIKHIAMSFHDTADILDTILCEQPEIEAVQLQLNYLDYDDPNVQSKACYDVAVKHGKKVIVMEPVRGGKLANLPPKAADALSKINNGSQASFALRYAASYENVFMVLSGMGNMEMMGDNIATMSDFVPLNEYETALTEALRKIIRESNMIPCTSCNYCADVCAKKIPISKIFDISNQCSAAKLSYREAKKLIPDNECIKCGKCEEVCPQGIKIRKSLETIYKRLD